MDDIPQYQDIWVKGQMVLPGQRECAKRYEIVRRVCAHYQRPFTVLDIGAADGYFAVRLAEDFPDCTVVAIDPRPRIGEVLKLNDMSRVLWLRKKMSVQDIHTLADVEHFDVTLALSIIHWMKEPPLESLTALRRLGDYLILELPVEDVATGQEIVQTLVPPSDGLLIGHGDSHLDPNTSRPIYLLSQSKTRLVRGYWGSDRDSIARIASDLESKTFTKGKKVSYPWMRGINLQTFLKLYGAYPSREHIAQCIRTAHNCLDSPHGDLMPWNVILQGDRASLIDAKPGSGRDDDVFLDRLITSVMETQ